MGKRKEAESEEYDSDFIDDEEDDYKPKKKASKPLKSSTPKQEAAVAGGASKSPATKSPKKQAFTEPFTDPNGWEIIPPSLMWKNFGDVKPSKKIAAFDLDSTLVHKRSNNPYVYADDKDWRWWNLKTTPKKLKELLDDGYKLVIFSNQGGIKSALQGKTVQKISGVLQNIYNDLCRRNTAGASASTPQGECEDVPLQVFVAPSMADNDPCRKPARGMWQHMVDHCNGGLVPDLSECFFVGDADGSSDAHSDSDKKFAENVGITFYTPGEYLGKMVGKEGINQEAARAGKEAFEEGNSPNEELIQQLKDMADVIKKATWEKNANFIARAYRNAADALCSFPDPITEANLTQVGKLKGVGKGTVQRIKTFVQTGSVWTDEDKERYEQALALHGGGDSLAAAAAAAAKPLTGAAQQAFAFM